MPARSRRLPAPGAGLPGDRPQAARAREGAPGFASRGLGKLSSSNMKAQELARELNVNPRELVNFLQQRRLTRNVNGPLPPKAIDAARSQFGATAVAVKVAASDRKVQLPPNLTVEDLALRLEVPTVEVIK